MNLSKRFILLMGLILMLLPGHHAAGLDAPPDKASADKTKPSQDWTYKKYLKAFRKTGRVTTLTAAEFARVQDRKPAMIKDIRRYLWRKFGWVDPRLIKAFEDLPREYFHYDYQGGADFSKSAYEYPPAPSPWAGARP